MEKYNFLKYWRVVRKWAFVKHGLSYPDLEMLLFLYSEGKFSRSDFQEYNELFPWKRDRFDVLLQKGHIIKWRNQKLGTKEGALYVMSHATTAIIRSVYRKLDGTEAIGENHNRLFNKDAGYIDRRYRNFIKKLNKETREAKG